jgi:hypothetical protein
VQVEDTEGRGLGLQMLQNAREYGVLHHVGEIAGVEGVAVVHAAVLGGAGQARKMQAAPAAIPSG